MNIVRNLILALSVLLCINLAAPALNAQNSPGNIQQQPQTLELETLLATGEHMFGKKSYDEALTIALRASALNPEDYRPYVLAGRTYMRMMKMKSASEAFANAIRLQPKAKELYLLKASADGGRHALDEAVAACRKALEIDPNYAEAYARMGSVLHWKKERMSEAVAAYEAALKINPGYFSAYESLGQLALTADDEKRAEELFRKAMATDPAHMSGRFALGRMLVKRGRLPEARELWEGRTSDNESISPKFVDLLTRAENLKHATEALAQRPNDPDALLNMGLAVMAGESWVFDGRQKRAIVYFKKVLELRPKDKQAQYNIVKGWIEVAFMFRNEEKTVDDELKKLKKLDERLAKEMEHYRKTYIGGLRGTPVDVNQ